MSASETLPRILHCHSASDASGMQARCIRLIQAIAGEAEHAIVVEGGGRLPGAERIGKGVRVTYPRFPSLTGKPWPGRLKRLAAAMAGYDLLCTYGAGALDAALAHTLFADVYKLAPLVHHEGAEEEGARSTFLRRIALGRTAALVVATRKAERIALERWQQPRSRVRLIPPGIDTTAFAASPKRDGIPGIVKRRGELWIGTIVAPGEVEALRPLIRCLRRLPEDWQLVVAGDGLQREAIIAEATGGGVEDRVHSANLPADPSRLVGLFDIFAPMGDIGAIEAMAAGLPIAAFRTQELDPLVASENGPFLSPAGDEEALSASIPQLAADKALRRRIGEANRAKAREEFDEARMIERHRSLYRSLMGRG